MLFKEGTLHNVEGESSGFIFSQKMSPKKIVSKCDATVFDLGYITDHTLGTRVAIKISTNHLW